MIKNLNTTNVDIFILETTARWPYVDDLSSLVFFFFSCKHGRPDHSLTTVAVKRVKRYWSLQPH